MKVRYNEKRECIELVLPFANSADEEVYSFNPLNANAMLSFAQHVIGLQELGGCVQEVIIPGARGFGRLLDEESQLAIDKFFSAGGKVELCPAARTTRGGTAKPKAPTLTLEDLGL